MSQQQPNNPLHGIKLQQVVEDLQEYVEDENDEEENIIKIELYLGNKISHQI